MVLTSLVHPYIKFCHFQWFSPYVSANVLGAATSRSRLGLKTSRLGQNSQRLGLGEMHLGSRLGLSSKGLVHIPGAQIS